MLVLIKEDLIILLTFLGLYLVLQRERWRGWIMIGSSLIVFFFTVGVIIPGFNDVGGYAYSGAVRSGGRCNMRQGWRSHDAKTWPAPDAG